MMRYAYLVFFFLLCLSANAQDDEQPSIDRQSVIEQRIEAIAEQAEDEDLDYTTLFEKLSVYIDFPLNLNEATATDLYELGLLTNYQIGEFMEFRAEYGSLFSKYELAQINGWDRNTAELIAPFVKVAPVAKREKITFKEMLKYGKNEWIVRYQRTLEEQYGYTPVSDAELADNPNARYLGSPDKIYTRYRYRYSDRISLGFTAEKDNGEELFRGSQPNGFDFYSAHLYLEDFGWLKQFSLGDFQAQFGQGLTFWSGLGFNRKSSYSVSTAQRGGGIGPYTSINENLFLRGTGTTINLGRFDVSLFYSGKKIDGNVADDGLDSLELDRPGVLVTSFQESGYHRTASEIADKNSIFQQHYGGNVSYNHKRLHLGFTAVQMELDGEIEPNSQEYSMFRFSGTQNRALGIDYSWKLRNFFFFGETSRSQNGALATMNGVNINMNPRLSVNITQRYYAFDFQPVASAGFGEGSTIENESGVYLGIEFRPFKKWKLNAYIDQFKFPWLRYQTDAPSTGYDFLAQIDYQPSSRFGLYVRYRDKNKQINTRDAEEGLDYLVDNPRKNLRFNFSYSAGNQWRFRSRVEFMRYERGNEPVSNGFLLYQDVIYSFQNLPLRLTFRYALFDSDSYDSRLYAYENDLRYFFSIPAYSGRGTRVYAMAKYSIGYNIDLWLRWAQYYYTDRNEISSGKEAIRGNTKTEIKAQVLFKF